MTTRPAGTPDLDLTFDGASGTVNGGVFMTGQFQLVPDHFSSFLEIRNNGVEQGYNTNGTLQYNTQDVQNSTHSVLLANVPIVIGDGSHGTDDGVAYREFRLNLGEAGTGKQYLSLDALQIWQEESGSLTSFTAGSIRGRTHELSRLRPRCGRRPLDRSPGAGKRQRRQPDRVHNPDPGFCLHQRPDASLHHALFQIRHAGRLASG